MVDPAELVRDVDDLMVRLQRTLERLDSMTNEELAALQERIRNAE